MNLLKSTRWAAIALGILGGSTSALACTVTPDSILTEGQTLQLVADCSPAKVDTINWKMAVTENGPASTITGDIVLNQTAVKKIYYTIPAELSNSGAGEYWFSVTGTSVGGTANDISTADPAKVVIKPANAVLSVANTVNPPVPGACGATPGAALQSMPTGTDQCSAGKAALAISGPTSFTWSCLGLNGGAEANCYGVRGYTVTATAGQNGSVYPTTQGVASGGTATITATPAGGFSAAISGCGGTQSGNDYTTGPVTANCTVTANFTNAPVNGTCGAASNSTVVTTAPSSNLCSTGSATSVATNATNYTWNCNGSNGGTPASCAAPRGYTITTSAGSNGSISPASKVVAANTTTTFSVTPASGFAATVTGCGGNLSGSTYTTGSTTAACTVSATFAVMTALTSDPGIGGGLWVPPNMSNRTVADQSGDANWTISYVPGCLNGQTAANSSSGCSAQTSYTGTIAGTTTSHTATMGSGKALVLRYRSKSTAGSIIQYIRTRAFDGGNVGMNMRVWLSTDPTATYANVPAACKQTSSRTPMVITGPGYCPIAPNTVYYYGMEYDETYALRFTVEESSADFL